MSISKFTLKTTDQFLFVFFFSYYSVDREQSLSLCTDPLLPQENSISPFFFLEGREGGSVHRLSVSLFSFPSLTRFARRTKKKKTTLCLTKAVSTGKDNLYFAWRRKLAQKIQCDQHRSPKHLTPIFLATSHER